MNNYTQRIKHLDSNIKNVLLFITDLLNNNNIKWSLGGSLMLKLRGLDVTVNDIDIIIDSNDIEFINLTLKPYIVFKNKASSIYLTDNFYELVISGVSIDVMVGFKVKTKTSIYVYDNSAISYELIYNNKCIYLSSLNEWLLAYKAMGRTDKIEVIESFLL